MSAQAVTKSTGADNTVSWRYTPVKYWPATDQAVDFVAWVDDAIKDPNGNTIVESNIDILPVSESDPAFSKTLEFTVDSEVKEQTDLLVADAVLDQNRAADNSAVALRFHHLLSRIGFQIIATGVPGENDNTTIVELNNITLTGSFAKTGTVDMTKAGEALKVQGTVEEGVSYTLTGKHFGWRNSSLKPEDVDPLENIIREGDSNNSADSYIMLIPTGAVPEKINVKYTVTTKNEDGSISGAPIENDKDFLLTDVRYEKGKAYKYIFYITMEGITFDVVVDNWDEQLVQDLNPEDSEWATIELQTGSQGTREFFYKGTLQVGTEIYVIDTAENSQTKGKKVKVDAEVEGTLTEEIGKFPVGTVIKVGADGKVTEITTPSAN